ncbi:MAG: dihydrodipicolinate synthase family protein [Promethearchaeota archaeon]
MPPINGVIVPALSFFNENFELDKELNSLLLRHIILNGANTILLFGYTGEGLYFKDKFEEKIRAVEIAVKASKATVPIVLGIYGNKSEEIIEQIEELGTKYPFVQFVISPPYAKKLETADLKAYFESIFGSLEIKNQLYLYNNPIVFAKNSIDPNIVSWLLSFSNFHGIKDSSGKIKTFKAYIEFLSNEFGVYCGREGNFATFLQLIPPEKRKFAGLVPSISNITNICSTLYDAALHEEILEVVRLQEELNDFRNKIYDIRLDKGKQQRGLKHAFYKLYENVITSPLKVVYNVCPEFQKSLDETTMDRIDATVNYLKNMNYIQQYYPIGENLYNIYDFNNIFLEIDKLKDLGAIKRIRGPREGKINIVYRLKAAENDIILRARTSKSFRYEDIVKEKLLFPFLDFTLHATHPTLREKVKKILVKESGSYFFNIKRPPIVPVGNLLYYDETKKLIPYIFTIQEYIRGKPLFSLLEKYRSEHINLNSTKMWNLFIDLGEILGKLHEIKFDSFHNNVTEIGKKNKNIWSDLFMFKLDKEIQEAKKNKIDFLDDIKKYFKDKESLLEENEPVLFHNDYQGQNIIVREEGASIKISGLIDFDNWQIGPRAADFVKMEYWTIGPLNEPSLKEAFYKGYIKEYKAVIDKEFINKIEIYKVLWLLTVFNFEKDKERKMELKNSIGIRFPLTEQYLIDLKKILGIL